MHHYLLIRKFCNYLSYFHQYVIIVLSTLITISHFVLQYEFLSSVNIINSQNTIYIQKLSKPAMLYNPSFPNTVFKFQFFKNKSSISSIIVVGFQDSHKQMQLFQVLLWMSQFDLLHQRLLYQRHVILYNILEFVLLNQQIIVDWFKVVQEEEVVEEELQIYGVITSFLEQVKFQLIFLNYYVYAQNSVVFSQIFFLQIFVEILNMLVQFSELQSSILRAYLYRFFQVILSDKRLDKSPFRIICPQFGKLILLSKFPIQLDILSQDQKSSYEFILDKVTLEFKILKESTIFQI
ncbi:transmembrane protein, putative (macronuclear) [Tetrahymena thermophila SB210]|uniref:Transmembrane protein, putative n=1 Tax=Tetrahymena thermophila (strain SB210) TaxID=312017 RepID=W7XIF2_TETTS|nr:transmembrane protein, putative [Tetrahymena thermophila SB210]EWS73239.1 transmembrane protein, putative [Tetrahymena thermophila SB210]|eukprot:XP_012654228.1 transmembrane protein, putative [Tetrahymena thermophila SB210]